MKPFPILNKIFLFPIYYLIHSNKFFGYIQKYYLKKFYYQNIIINLNIDNIPLANYSSFLFKTLCLILIKEALGSPTLI